MTIWVSQLHNKIENNYAFIKPRNDISIFAQEIGAKPLHIADDYKANESDEAMWAKTEAMLTSFQKGDSLILQLPIFIRPKNVLHLIDSIHQKGGKIIGLIHDYERLRMPHAFLNDTQDPYTAQFSYRSMDLYIEKFDALISHGEAFGQKVRELTGVSYPMVVQGPFGYRFNGPAQAREFGQTVSYAGNIGKAGWLFNLPESVQLNLYGNMDQEQKDRLTPNINYKGFVDTESMPRELAGNWGLVWDSTSFPDVTGFFGDYQRYNMPFKLSGYLASHLPVIVWSQSAAAKYVLENGLGIVIDDLTQLQDAVAAVTQEVYQEMLEKVKLHGRLIQTGHHTKRAILQATAEAWQITLP